MKQLTQAVFSLPECPEWALSAALKAGKPNAVIYRKNSAVRV